MGRQIHNLHLFDDGWNKLREQEFREPEAPGGDSAGHQTGALADRRSSRTGMIARPEEKKLYIRQVEVFAAFAAYNDHEIGRVIQAVEDMGKLDNTLIIYINGDNGTSAEGGPLGTPNEVAFFNGVTVSVPEQMKWYDVWGTEQTYNHMSAGWSWAFDTPFTWFKQNASKLGGIRQGMAVSWPGHIKNGALREQFMHVIDVVCPPSSRSPASPRPNRLTASSRRPWKARASPTPSMPRTPRRPCRHQTQYFEMMGQWALYHEGWLLSTKVNRAPWEAFGAANPDPLNNQVLELYDLNKDFSQSQNLAVQHPVPSQCRTAPDHRQLRRPPPVLSTKGEAISYPIAVPREQSRWQGATIVSDKRINPSGRRRPR